MLGKEGNKRKKIESVEDGKEAFLAKCNLELDVLIKTCRLVQLHLANTQRIIWLKKPETLIYFFRLLSKHHFINSTCDAFVIHFNPSGYVINKVRFLENFNKLGYLIGRLVELGFVSGSKTPHKRLMLHFSNEDGGVITNKVLRSLKNKVMSEESKEFIEEKIIKKLQEYEKKPVDAI